MKVLIKSATWNDEQIKLIEEKYKAKYVMDACLQNGTEWLNFPVSIFYTGSPHPDGSNYFAFYKHPVNSKVMITNGYSAIKDPIEGILTEDGTVIYSRYRHDLVEYDDVFIDGGRDYVRIGGDGMFKSKPVLISVVNGKVQVRLKES